MRDRRIQFVVLLLAVTAFLSFSALAVDPFSFVVISDTHDVNKCNIQQGHWVDDAIPIINDLNPDFVVGVGDLIAGGDDQCTDAKNNEAQLAEFKNKILDELTVPFVPVGGNHDLLNAPGSRQEWELFWSSNADQVYQNGAFPGFPYSYKFNHKGAGFSIIDWYGINGVKQEEIDWVQANVQPNDLVFRHVNLLATSCFVDDGSCNFAVEGPENLVDSLFLSLQTKNIAALFSGHNHAYYDGLCNNVRFVNTGTLGKRLLGYTKGLDEDFHGQAFALITVTDSSTPGVLSLETEFYVYNNGAFEIFDNANFPTTVLSERTTGKHKGVNAQCTSIVGPLSVGAASASPASLPSSTATPGSASATSGSCPAKIGIIGASNIVGTVLPNEADRMTTKLKQLCPSSEIIVHATGAKGPTYLKNNDFPKFDLTELDALIISPSGNGISYQSGSVPCWPSSYENSVKTMITEARNAGVEKVAVIAVHPRDNGQAYCAKQWTDHLISTNLNSPLTHVVDTYSLLEDPSQPGRCGFCIENDQLHWNKEGAGKVAQKIATEVFGTSGIVSSSASFSPAYGTTKITYNAALNCQNSERCSNIDQVWHKISPFVGLGVGNVFVPTIGWVPKANAAYGTGATTTVSTPGTTPTLTPSTGLCFPLKQDSFDHVSWNFGDRRGGGARCHVGIDIYTNAPGKVIAIADGTVVATSTSFLTCDDGWGISNEGLSSGEAGKIVVYHPSLGKTVNYGEIDANKMAAVTIGQSISKGQELGIASYCGMLHFELYEGKVDDSERWYPPSGQSVPAVSNYCRDNYLATKSPNIMDPTEFLTSLGASQTALADTSHINFC